MTNERIILSEKHGLNPSLEVCLACGKDIGIVMFGKLKDDIKAPKQVCLGHLCNECENKFKENHQKMLVETTEDGITGRYYIIEETWINPKFLEDIGDKVVVYLTEYTFKDIEDHINNTNECVE